MMVNERMSSDNVVQQLRHPAMMIGTDGRGIPFDGPLATGLPHPRNFGTFPRVLGEYVREQQVLTLPEAIHKMTGLPAKTLGFRDRGLLKTGYKADVVVFDPDTVSDRATYLNPFQPPLGIPFVFVNGVRVVDNGKHTSARPGRILGST
jgi:N-acyl-D-amino-acid deacylase